MAVTFSEQPSNLWSFLFHFSAQCAYIRRTFFNDLSSTFLSIVLQLFQSVTNFGWYFVFYTISHIEKMNCCFTEFLINFRLDLDWSCGDGCWGRWSGKGFTNFFLSGWVLLTLDDILVKLTYYYFTYPQI